MSERRWKTLLHAYWLNLGSKGAEIAYFLLLVSLLGKSELGLFNTLMSLTLLFLTALDFGLSQATLREIAQHTIDVRALLRRSIPTRVIATIVAIGAVMVASVTGYATILQAQVLILLALFQLANALQSIMLAALQGQGMQTRSNQLASAEAIVKLAMLALLKWMVPIVDLLSIVASLAVIKIVFSALTWTLLPPLPEAATKSPSSRYSIWNPIQLGDQLGFVGIAVFTILQNRLDWLMVSAFMDSVSVASYSVVNRYYEILLFALGIGFTTIYPWLCRIAATRRQDRTLQLLRQLQFLPVPLLVAAGIFAFPLVNELFWQGRYDDAVDAVGWLLPCAGLAVGNMMIYYDLMAQRHENVLLRLCVTSTVLQALFNVWAIPRLGIHGAIIGMWLMNFANLLLFAIAARKRIYDVRETAFTIAVATAISVTLLLAFQFISAALLLLLVMLISVVVAWFVWLNKARMLMFRAESAS